MSDELEPVKTSDTPFAAFLFYHQHVFVGVKPEDEDPRRIEFVFVSRDDTKDLTDEYYMKRPLVNPKKYYYAIDTTFKELKKYFREHGE